MQTKECEYIEEIAKYGNISKAAGILGIDQSTLTKFLQRKEDELGVPLFHRIGKQFFPTQAGECYLEQSKKMLRLCQELDWRIRQIKAEKRGELRIGVTYSRIGYICSVVLPALQKEFPELYISVDVDKNDRLLEKIQRRTLDVGFINYKVIQPGIWYQFISRDEMVLWTCRGSDLEKKSIQHSDYPYPCIELKQWISQPFIMVEEDTWTGRFVRRFFLRHHVEPNIVARVGELQSARHLVKSEIGISVGIGVDNGIGQDEISYLSVKEMEQAYLLFGAAAPREVAGRAEVQYAVKLVRSTYKFK